MSAPSQRPRRTVPGIAVAAAVALVVVASLGWLAFSARPDRGPGRPDTSEPSAAIAGLLDLRTSDPASIEPGHASGDLSYPQVPPIGGIHSPVWQNCTGDVYPAQIADEHAVHSLEHGAVWITYRPDLPPGQVELLATRVRNRDHLMLSPHPDQDAPVSLQAWGLQLTVTTADDPRIDSFITAFRLAATAPEPDAPCSQGTTLTGREPF